MIKMNLILKDEAIKLGLSVSEPSVQVFANFDPTYDVRDALGPFSSTWVSASGLVDTAVVTCFDNDNNYVLLVLNRHRSVGHYKPSILAPLEELKQHLSRVFSKTENDLTPPSWTQPFIRYVEEQHRSTLLLNSRGNIIANSEASNELLDRYADDIRVVDSYFTLANQELNHELERVRLEMMIVDHRPEAKHNILVPCSARLPLILELAHAFGPNATSSLILLAIYDPNRALNVSAKDVSRIIKATESEARVIANLVAGYSPSEVAENLDLKENTVRSYIKVVLAKNSYNRQLDMINDINRIMQLMY